MSPRRFTVWKLTGLLVLFVLATPAWCQTPGMLSFQALIKDANGDPVHGDITLEFRIYDAELGGNLVDIDGDGLVEDVVGEDVKEVVTNAANGIVSVQFGPVHSHTFEEPERWLEVSVEGSPLSRLLINAVPMAAQLQVPAVDPGNASAASVAAQFVDSGSFGPQLHIKHRQLDSTLVKLGPSDSAAGTGELSLWDFQERMAVQLLADISQPEISLYRNGRLRLWDDSEVLRGSLSADVWSMKNSLGDFGLSLHTDENGGQLSLYDQSEVLRTELKGEGGLIMRDGSGNDRIALDAADGSLELSTSTGTGHLSLYPGQLTMFVPNGIYATLDPLGLQIHDSLFTRVIYLSSGLSGIPKVSVHAESGSGAAETEVYPGRVVIRDTDGQKCGEFNFDESGGNLDLFDNAEVARVSLGSGGNGLTLADSNGLTRVALTIDHDFGVRGKLELLDDAGIGRVVAQSDGSLWLKDAEGAGYLTLSAESQGSGDPTIDLRSADGSEEAVLFSGGLLVLSYPAQGRDSHHTVLTGEKLEFWGPDKYSPHVSIDATTGELTTMKIEVTGGSDLAEPFAIAQSADGAQQITPGMLVVIDSEHPGQLSLAQRPYDQSVAGVVSGAGGLKPAVVMSGEATVEGSVEWPVALAGRVYAWADASYGVIKPGDLLTTSATPGHAMRATDRARAFGAVIGKAMQPLVEGRGLVLVLVQPQ